MKSSFASFLRVIVLLIGIGVVAFLLWQPTVEGRNVNATLFEIYFTDPFLAYAYIVSIPFFVGLYQVFRLLGYAGRNELFAQHSVKALETIKYCASAMPVFIVVGVLWLLMMETDDRPPIVAMGTIVTLLSIGVATAASALKRKVQQAIDGKSGNDRTV